MKHTRLNRNRIVPCALPNVFKFGKTPHSLNRSHHAAINELHPAFRREERHQAPLSWWRYQAGKRSGARTNLTKAARGTFLLLDYTWNYEGTPQEGVMLLGYDAGKNAATMACGKKPAHEPEVHALRGRHRP